MDTSKASARPWQFCGHQKGGCSCGHVWTIPGDFPVCSATPFGTVVHEHMADAPDMIYQSISVEMKKANAALIVQAVNNYEPLLLALESARDSLLNENGNCPAVEAANNALKAAKG